MGRLALVDNEQREEPNEQQGIPQGAPEPEVQSAQVEPSPPSAPGESPLSSSHETPSGAPPSETEAPRGGHRRSRSRRPMRDRRGDRRRDRGDRDRDRRHAPHASHASHHTPVPSSEPPREEAHSRKANLLREARHEVDRICQVLQQVLEDLEDISEQLSKAEQEKDVAEEEIENLRDQLRRLHR